MFVTANGTRKYQQMTDGSSGGSGGQATSHVPTQTTQQPTGAFGNI